MHVGVYVKCIYTNFGGRGLFGFGNIATFKNGQISLSDHGLHTEELFFLKVAISPKPDRVCEEDYYVRTNELVISPAPISITIT